MSIISSLATGARALGRVAVQPAAAHCDTEDGPAVTDGRRALASGNVNLALKWVSAEAEDEVRTAFATARMVRAAGGDAAELADRTFLETLVRVHRAGEGVDFDGVKPAGTAQPPQVVAADKALGERTIEPLRGLVPDDRWPELEQRFDDALAKRNFGTNDLPAAREYVDAYVKYFTYAEGEDDHAHRLQSHG